MTDCLSAFAALTLALEREGWEVHQQVEDPSMSGPALEDDPSLFTASDEEKQGEIVRRLQSVDAAHAEHKRALILYCSHIGGHKYAGNVIVRVVPRPLPSTVTPTPQPRLPSYVGRFRLT